jgi:hypothetical protein
MNNQNLWLVIYDKEFAAFMYMGYKNEYNSIQGLGSGFGGDDLP